MGVGHAALALGAAKVAPRINVGWFVFAALLADFLLGIFAALGLEQAHIPLDYATRHYLTFTFPYSHGLVPLLLWGVLFGFLVSRLQTTARQQAFLLLAAFVVSHFLLDGLVHVAGLPLLGDNSPKFGLGLWNHLLLELTLETVMAIMGAALYLSIAGPGMKWRSSAILALLLLLTVATWGQLFASQAPTQAQLIPGWIIMPVLFSGAVYLLDRRRAKLSQLPQLT